MNSFTGFHIGKTLTVLTTSADTGGTFSFCFPLWLRTSLSAGSLYQNQKHKKGKGYQWAWAPLKEQFIQEWTFCLNLHTLKSFQTYDLLLRQQKRKSSLVNGGPQTSEKYAKVLLKYHEMVHMIIFQVIWQMYMEKRPKLYVIILWWSWHPPLPLSNQISPIHE